MNFRLAVDSSVSVNIDGLCLGLHAVKNISASLSDSVLFEE